MYVTPALNTNKYKVNPFLYLFFQYGDRTTFKLVPDQLGDGLTVAAITWGQIDWISSSLSCASVSVRIHC